MAGRPVTRAARDLLSKREDEVFDRLARGEPVTRLCEDLDVSPQSFYRWKNETEEREQLFKEVREMAAHGLVDEALRIVDDAREEGQKLTAAQARIVTKQADQRQWLAGKFSDFYSDRTKLEPDAMENFAEAFVQSIVKANKQAAEELDRNATASDKLRAIEAEEAETPEADYEILDGEPGESAEP